MSKPFILANQAATGFSDASNYDKYRPSYPPEAVDKLLQHLGLSSQRDARVVELGSGTGKFTELLVARPEQFEIIAVEPHEGMRSTLVDKKLGVKVLDGNAASMPVEEGWGML
ncbi:putative methyltransferase Mb3374 [Hyphodiscus hymeniophilus]|uniref:Methyltransferase Mb3374 n=1 Tax=Hyphodiscus hymeniophilus TaxID=353542 RepID=A0A9P7AZF1_9HELO|nr:putative methyltransferase Mb3374 [Hyphodiscus hymeniophilus]